MNKEIYIGKYWERTSNNRIRCFLCPRYCQLKEGQRGFCFVRQNINSKMVLTTYGRSSGFCIDPVEKKPLNHFYPGTPVFSFGTAGCNLGCKFCQNWDISKSREFDKLLDQASPKQIAQTAKDFGCSSVAFTYNDPVIFAEYAIDVARACHEVGLKTIAVSAGYITREARTEFFDVMDAANIDLKAFTERFYQKCTLSSLQTVLDTLIYIKQKTNVWLEITNLIIPGENDSEAEIHEMSLWIIKNLGRDVPIHFTAFHPDYKMLNHQPTPKSLLLKARNIALSTGLNFVYTGNIAHNEGSNTYCNQCGQTLIERDQYDIRSYNLKENKCNLCGSICSGFFESQPGRWGNKRLPVKISKN